MNSEPFSVRCARFYVRVIRTPHFARRTLLQPFKLRDFFTPVIRDEDAGFGVVVIGHHHRLGPSKNLAGFIIHDLVLEGEALVAQARHADIHSHLLAQRNGRQVGHVHIRHDHAALKKVLAVPQTQGGQVIITRLFNKGVEARVVDMPLGIQVPVAHRNMCGLFKCGGHGDIIMEIREQ